MTKADIVIKGAWKEREPIGRTLFDQYEEV